MKSWKTREAREYVDSTLALVREHTEKCREQALAITKLEEADMWLRAMQDRQEKAEQDADEIPY